MFDSVTEDAKQALNRARQHGQRLSHDFLGTEHLLLGILDGKGSSALTLLDSLGIESGKLRSAVERELVAGNARDTLEQLPFTSGLKKVLELSMREAQALGSRHLAPEHFLLGLAGDPESAAHRALAACGFSVEDARAFVKSRADAVRPGGSGDHRSAGWRLRVLEDAVDVLVELREVALAESMREIARRHGSRK